MQQEITVIDGNTFMISDAAGDVLPEQTGGFFCADTRFLSHYELRLNGESPRQVASHSADHLTAIFYATNPGRDDLPAHTISLTRRRSIGDRLRDELALENFSGQAVRLDLALLFGADFADIFDAKTGQIAQRGRIEEKVSSQQVEIIYRRASFERRTVISFSQTPAALKAGEATFRVELGPGERWEAAIEVQPVQGNDIQCGCRNQGPSLAARRGLSDWLASVPQLRSDDHNLQRAYGRAVRDLAALRLPAENGHLVPAAGLPWFMALFGRDSIITGFEALLIGPELARGALEVLAGHQGREINDFRDEEPGKILHEIRRGELAALGDTPHATYYGSVDVTPLFLILISETYGWTGDDERMGRLLPAADAALDWIDRYGDRDGDGFVEYSRRSATGLPHQGWKDSVDPIRFADGVQAEGPIALAEVQGYVYDAKRRLADLYARRGHPARARDLLAQAEKLKAQYDEAFWLPDEGYYALALDGRKRPVDSVTSNPAHGLWSGIVPPARAATMVERLLAPDMFTGWGVRTMSSQMKGYNPLSYHNGSVWPHDNAIIAAGLARYGFRREASRIISALLQASSYFSDHRLPELFAGFARDEAGFPVRYPTACSPQAWAAAAVIQMLCTLLGATVGPDGMVIDPLPDCPRVEMEGIRVRNQRLRLATGAADSLSLTPMPISVSVA